ncbi:hypothetical protein CH373_16965 [Leptospira perolatii]|uniref:Uncharacterized protein n=1 Tax=Leptospira perolatii TaxID=2023191 RepID=A0A2M9ZIZ2_9LEPT|nr:hypothetical protein [Leptospira perolatii]PJZ68449.1 hypothetical protein CH360_16035 [Leptospira perolatii]PJZ71923.1 hypothetical protein CH373_16965 [Leptospira perolatii]
MFIGHYGVSYALKKAEPKAPFWALLIGVQFVDVLFMSFILLGIEKMRLVPGFTEVNPFDLYFMPYTHSLVATVFWSVLTFFLFKFLFLKNIDSKIKNRVSLVVAISVASHFFLDLPMHTKDLPLFTNDGLKIGFGLWNYRIISISLEVLLLGIGAYLYFTNTKPKDSFGGKYGMHIFIGILFVLAVATPFLPIPATITEFGIQGLFGYFAIAAIGGWLDSKRIPISSN